jgi:hypothetical protein
MPRKASHSTLQKQLHEMLCSSFPGMTIEVEHSTRWDRTCLTFRWAGFAGTLPEERFRRLLIAIPPEFREKKLAGAVWLELAPEESIDEYLALPRSEDIADREGPVARRLIKADFFRALEKRLAPLPVEQSMADLTATRELLSELGWSDTDCRDACLLLIRHGAYSDCDVLLEAKPSILALEKPS